MIDYSLQVVVAVARYCGGGDRQQRAAKAMADALYLLIWHDRTDCIECCQDAERPVVVESRLRSSGPGLFQEIMNTEVLYQRILRREIENVILHDSR